MAASFAEAPHAVEPKVAAIDARNTLGYTSSVQGNAVGLTGLEHAADASILWSVVEEHLDEAEFGLECFHALFDSPILTLESLVDIEALLDAHVDGLVVGGKAVAERLLLPLLDDAEAVPARIAAATLALLAAAEINPVIAALTHASPAVRKSALLACRLAPAPRMDAAVSQALAPGAAAMPGALMQLAATRSLAIPSLLVSLASTEEEEQIAALRAVSHANAQELAWVEQLMSSPNERVRESAMFAGLQYGSHQAWSVCQSAAVDSDSPSPLALALFAGLADPAQQAVLYQLTQSEQHRYVTLGCLGYTGSVLLVPWLIQQAASKDERTAKLAGEAFSIITGAASGDLMLPDVDEGPPGTPSELAAEDEEALTSLPPLEEDDLDADLALNADDALPRPDPRALEAWWQANEVRFDPRVRYLAGAPLSFDAFRHALEFFPLRRRHVLSALLTIRTAGVTRIDTRAFTRTQHAQLSQIPTGVSPWARQYSGF